MPKTLQDIYNDLKRVVNAHESKMIIEHVTDHQAEILITSPNDVISKEHQDHIEDIIKRRLKGEPLTRILGVREFWGLEFEVTLDTLDPRPDTETLVEVALKWATNHPKHKPFRILDLGTGTGCIPIALLSELPHAIAVAVDYSYDAALVARKNAATHKMSNRFHIIQGDWMSAIKPESFDLIVSNPPYISNEVIQNLECEVKNHDPILALSGGNSGLDCYEKIISALKINLNDKNRAFLEIGFDQLESVSRLVDDSNLRLCESYRDLAGNQRVVEISTRA